MKHVRFVFSSACVSPPPLSRASPRPSLKSWAAFRKNLMAAAHAVAMEIATLKGCGEAFCFIKWLRGMTKHTWASGMKDVRSRFDLFTELPVLVFFLLFFFFKWRQIARNKVVVYSFPRVWLSLPPNAAILDKFMKKQMAATGALPAVLEVCAPFGWKTRRSVCETQPVRLCLSIILLSSSSSKKRAIAFVLRLCICFHVIFTVAEKDVLRTVLRRKIAAWYEAFVNCQLMLKKKKKNKCLLHCAACDEVWKIQYQP